MLPHLLVLSLWTYLAVPVGLVNWVIALVRGRPSDRVHGWMERLVRYQAHVYGFLYLIANPFPVRLLHLRPRAQPKRRDRMVRKHPIATYHRLGVSRHEWPIAQ